MLAALPEAIPSALYSFMFEHFNPYRAVHALVHFS